MLEREHSERYEGNGEMRNERNVGYSRTSLSSVSLAARRLCRAVAEILGVYTSLFSHALVARYVSKLEEKSKGVCQ